MKTLFSLLFSGSLALDATGCAGSQAEIESFARGNASCLPAAPEQDQAFSAEAAQRVLIEAEETASSCSEAAKRTSGRVLMTWGNGGCILNAQFALEDTGLTPRDLDCIANAFLAARIGQFSGEPVSVVKAMLPE